MACSNTTKKLYVGEPNTIFIDALRDRLTNVYVNNDTTAQATFFDQDGYQIGSALDLDYVTASDGDYEGITDSDLFDSVELGSTVIIKITVDGILNRQLERQLVIGADN